MSQPLTPGTIRCIERLFPESQRQNVADLLLKRCSNLPDYCGDERYQLAILKLSGGDFDELVSLIRYIDRYATDWRDILMDAGFGEPSAHLSWRDCAEDHATKAAALPRAPRPKSRFSLRTLLIATTLVAVVLGLIVWAAA